MIANHVFYHVLHALVKLSAKLLIVKIPLPVCIQMEVYAFLALIHVILVIMLKPATPVDMTWKIDLLLLRVLV